MSFKGYDELSRLDEAMKKHIEFLCLVEQRPFSYFDFLQFTVDGKSYRISHGTFRNKVSELIKRDKVEWLCDSPQGFYILNGSQGNPNTITDNDHTVVNPHDHIFIKDKITNQSRGLVDEILMNNGASRTENPRIITNNPLFRYVKSIPFGQLSIHDIRLRFESYGIWDTLSSSVNRGNENERLQGLKIENRSKDFSFSQLKIDNLYIKVRIHKTDKVSVIIGCSYSPVTLDIEGIQRLSNALSLVQMELSRLVLCIENDNVNVVARKKWDSQELVNDNLRATGTSSPVISTPVIPRFMDWIVTMWHYGADAVHEYSGEKFNCRWELAQNIVASIYSKDWKKLENENNNKQKNRGSGHESSVKSRIRVEKQEYPKVSLGKSLRNNCHDVMEAFEK